jgi:hypothetical protein
VYIVPIPGPGPRVPVSVDGGDEPVWSRDGVRLFYRNTTHMMAAIVAERNGLTITRRDTLFRDIYRRYSYHPAYDAFPDGRLLMTRALIASANAGAPVFAITNWPQMLK